MTVYCYFCDRLEARSRAKGIDRHYEWLCLAAPDHNRKFQFQVPKPFLAHPPLKKCSKINPEGECPLYEITKDDRVLYHLEKFNALEATKSPSKGTDDEQ